MEKGKTQKQGFIPVLISANRYLMRLVPSLYAPCTRMRLQIFALLGLDVTLNITAKVTTIG